MMLKKHITQKVASLAEQLEIPCQQVGSMNELGEASGVEVNASTVAVEK